MEVIYKKPKLAVIRKHRQVFYARVKVGGKLVRRKLKMDVYSKAPLGSAIFEGAALDDAAQWRRDNYL